MKTVHIVGLCLSAVFALGTFAAPSASAGDLLARVAGGGGIAGVTFLSLGLLALLTTHGGREIHCEHVHDHGLFLTATLGNILILFLSCTFKFVGTEECNTPGSPEGQIHLPLSTLFHLGLAHLVLATTTDRIPATAVLPPSGGIKVECAHGQIHLQVLGAVIGALQNEKEEPLPLNTPFSSSILNFQQAANGLQRLRLILMPGGALTSYDLHTFVNEAELTALNSLTSLHLFRLSNGTEVDIELVEP